MRMALGTVALLLSAGALALGDDDTLRRRAAEIHERALVLDAHNDVTTFILDFGFDLGTDGGGPEKRDATLYWIPELHWILPDATAEDLRMDTDLNKLRTGGVDAQFFSIFSDSSYASEPGASKRRALAMLEATLAQVERYPEALELATSVGDVRRIAASGRIAALLGLEGGHAIEDEIANLRDFYSRGIRYMTLTWNNTNNWADSCYERRHGGLTPFGREVVQEMNRLGMIVDISHVSDETFYDALEVSHAPVMASHSSARALTDHPRNMSDEMLRAVAMNGGVVMINFQEIFIDPGKSGVMKSIVHVVTHFGWEHTPLSLLIDHIDHVVRVAGIDHVGLGSDFAGTFLMPEDMRDVSAFPNITLELLKRGYSEEAIGKILGENALRVFSEVEASRIAADGSAVGASVASPTAVGEHPEGLD